MGRSRGGLTTKIHALVDSLRMLARFSLIAAQTTDTGKLLPLLGELPLLSFSIEQAYDTNAILQHLKSLGIQALIPSKENHLEQRSLDKHLYDSHDLIVHFFSPIKQFRRVATRYEKLLQRFVSFVAPTASFIWLC